MTQNIGPNIYAGAKGPHHVLHERILEKSCYLLEHVFLHQKGIKGHPQNYEYDEGNAPSEEGIPVAFQLCPV